MNIRPNFRTLAVVIVPLLLGCATTRPWWYSDKTSVDFDVEKWDISLGVICPDSRGTRVTGELMLGCQFVLYASRSNQAGYESFEVDSIWALDPFSADEDSEPYIRTRYTRLGQRVPWQTSLCIPREYEFASNPPLCSHECRDSCGFEVQEGDRIHGRIFCRIANRGKGLPDSNVVLNGIVRAPVSWRAYFKGLPPTSGLP